MDKVFSAVLWSQKLYRPWSSENPPNLTPFAKETNNIDWKIEIWIVLRINVADIKTDACSSPDLYLVENHENVLSVLWIKCRTSMNDIMAEHRWPRVIRRPLRRCLTLDSTKGNSIKLEKDMAKYWLLEKCPRLIYQFILIAIHGCLLFVTKVRFMKTADKMWHVACRILGQLHKRCEGLVVNPDKFKGLAGQLSKRPKHLSLILMNGCEKYIEELSTIAVWSFILGTSFITVYDKEGDVARPVLDNLTFFNSFHFIPQQFKINCKNTNLIIMVLIHVDCKRSMSIKR